MTQPSFPQLAGFSVDLMGPENLESLAAFHETCSAFFELVHGRSPVPEDATDLLTERPPGVAAADKRVIAISRDGEIVAVLDLLSNYPIPQTWYLGLLMLAPAFRGQGLGSTLCSSTLDWIAGLGGREVHLIVQEQNPRALHFWLRMGFVAGEELVQDIDGRRNRVSRMVRKLP